MKWTERFSLLVRANLSSVRERIEKPERMLSQLIIDMEEELETLRTSVAEAIADEIQLAKRVERERRETDAWRQRSEECVRTGDEARAKRALSERLKAEERLERLSAEHEHHRRETEKLRDAVRDMESRIRQASERRTLLLAKIARADTDRKISGALGRVSGRSATAQFRRLEERVERGEALREAYDRLDGDEPEVEALRDEFESEEREKRLQEEYESLRERVGAANESPQSGSNE